MRCRLLRPDRGAEYCDQPVCLCVCLPASISLEPLDRSARNFVCASPVAVARSSSDGVALRYVLPVLWMTSRSAVMGATPARVGSTQRRRSMTCATVAESDVYERLFIIADAPMLSECNQADSTVTSVTVSWQQAAGAVYYTYGYDSKQSRTGTETSVVVGGLENDSTYKFTVTVHGRNFTGNSVVCEASTCMSLWLVCLFCPFYTACGYTVTTRDLGSYREQLLPRLSANRSRNYQATFVHVGGLNAQGPNIRGTAHRHRLAIGLGHSLKKTVTTNVAIIAMYCHLRPPDTIAF